MEIPAHSVVVHMKYKLLPHGALHCLYVKQYQQSVVKNMASNAHVEQHVLIKYLVNEGVKPGEIYSRLLSQYDDETLSRSKKFEWCKRFKEGLSLIHI